MQVSKSPTIHLEETTLSALETYRQELLNGKSDTLNYDKVVALLLKNRWKQKTKRKSKKEKSNV